MNAVRAVQTDNTGVITLAEAFRSTHTRTLPDLLHELDVSLVLSTYQRGRVIVLRPDHGHLSALFPPFPRPMGLALHRDLLAIATRHEVWIYQDHPIVAASLRPPDRYDACYLPRACHVTGDIRVHDVAFAGNKLWIVNTRFSCLATLDSLYSFVPRWQPSFVTALSAEDRCHLNGLAVVDDEPRFVTALAVSDEPEGWRADKEDGGVVLDVPSGGVVVAGLCMPHSPRWHDGRLWVLESGHGRLGVVDVERGTVETVVELPGFTRGLDFVGPYAFVGLSQVRDKVFEGIPVTDNGPDRRCGVWVVDTRSGGVVGFVRFEELVREIFAVIALPGRTYPQLVDPASRQVANAFRLAADPRLGHDPR
ncbi:MAG: TIGR03032 family protein [Acidimicrobiales bacterium]|jgi:uncharacterized protein (TIGR03032 family)|nr:TIGR03032 family protein [Acidimicrobiales bacterium]